MLYHYVFISFNRIMHYQASRDLIFFSSNWRMSNSFLCLEFPHLFHVALRIDCKSRIVFRDLIILWSRPLFFIAMYQVRKVTTKWGRWPTFLPSFTIWGLLNRNYIDIRILESRNQTTKPSFRSNFSSLVLSPLVSSWFFPLLPFQNQHSKIPLESWTWQIISITRITSQQMLSMPSRCWIN